MTVRIRIPANLREFTERQGTVEVNGSQVNEALQSLIEAYPGLREKLLASDGQLQSFINLFVGDRSVRELEGLATELSPGATLLIVSALAGG